MIPKKIQVKPIVDKNELLKVVLFLKSAFNWSYNKAIKIYDNLLLNNQYLGVYGYCLKNKIGVIEGGLLIFDQCKPKNELKFINMSSWYVNPNMRGYGSIKMIKTLIKDYPDHILTNVSSNKIAYEVLKAFRFKDAGTINRKFTIISLIKNFNIFDFSLYKFFFKNKKNNFLKPKNSCLDKSYCKKFFINNSSFSIIFIPTIWEKKIWFFYLKIKGIRILSTSDSEKFSKYFYHILNYYFIRNFSLFTTTHCAFDIPYNNCLSSSKQIYLAPKNKIYTNLELALGSELEFF